jgi:hypothetical protein
MARPDMQPVYILLPAFCVTQWMYNPPSTAWAFIGPVSTVQSCRESRDGGLLDRAA